MSKRRKGRNRDDYGLKRGPAPTAQKAAAPKASAAPPADPDAAARKRNTIIATAMVVLFLAAALALFLWLPRGAGDGDYKQPLPSSDANPRCKVETTMGDFTIELFPKDAPITVKNFLDYVHEKHYDGTIFHRVMPDFMIQGGGFDTNLKGKDLRAPIRNESDNGLPNKRGTLAMARTNDPNSATDQFFINVKDNAFLNQAQAKDGVGYAVFGQVLDGMPIVNTIRAVRTVTRGEMEHVPLDPVIIKSIRHIN